MDIVNNPSHYGGNENPLEVIKVCEFYGLDKDAYLFNVVKYILRSELKGNYLQDLKKAQYYLNKKIANLESLEK